MVTTDVIKKLRDETGVSVMQCKKALEEAGGDVAKAIVILKKKGADAAAKKADRTLNAGTIAAYVHATGTVGAMVEIACETDFVAKNPEFKQLAYDIAMHIAASKPEFLRKEDAGDLPDRALLEQPFIKNPEMTIAALVASAVQKFGEKTEIIRFDRFGVLEK